jgi:hypothetical protein
VGLSGVWYVFCSLSRRATGVGHREAVARGPGV